ncbi:hypothetical protein [Corynebacterium poyangense]|uniref:hypothetical protein n=1 Tax=Corynebacterium poyangense TaxID=2684405 RepID=UPI001CCEEB1A|nr:hypothetical protein [Corynebacterium poyangense]
MVGNNLPEDEFGHCPGAFPDRDWAVNTWDENNNETNFCAPQPGPQPTYNAPQQYVLTPWEQQQQRQWEAQQQQFAWQDEQYQDNQKNSSSSLPVIIVLLLIVVILLGVVSFFITRLVLG